MAGGGWDSVALRAPCAAGHPQLRRGFTDSPGVFEGRLLGEGSTAGLSESAAQRVGGLARLPPGAPHSGAPLPGTPLFCPVTSWTDEPTDDT